MSDTGKFEYNNFTVIDETNYSILDPFVEVWNGEFPFNTGDTFPTDKIKNRASWYNTNYMLYNNKIKDVLDSFLYTLPMVDLVNQMQIRELITGLPDFKNATDSWVTLMAAKAPFVEVSDSCTQNDMDNLLRVAGISNCVKHIIKSSIMCGNAVVRVDLNESGNVVFRPIKCGRWQPYVFENDPQGIQVNMIFNQYSKDGSEYIEFICFHYNGRVERRTFEYSSNTLGKELEDLRYDGNAFDGVELSPIVVFSHNTVDGNIIGVDEYRYWEAAILITIRCLFNIMKLADRSRENVKIVPNSALTMDEESGITVDINKGSIGYDNLEKIPEVKYSSPDIANMQYLLELYDRSVQRVSIDTQLGLAFYDSEKLGSNLSAKAIEASMYPAKIKATSFISELESPLKELVIKCAAAGGMTVSEGDISLTFYNSFPNDKKELTETIQSRIGTTLSTVDAIQILDGVTRDVADKKSKEILSESTVKKTCNVNNSNSPKPSLNENVGDIKSGDGTNSKASTTATETSSPGNPLVDSILE